MQFKARKADLTLDLETLDGTVLKLTSDKNSTTDYKNFMKLVNDKGAMVKLKGAQLDPESLSSDELIDAVTQSVDVLCTTIDYFYEKTPLWWEKNFDPQTLQAILQYIISEFKGASKN